MSDDRTDGVLYALSVAVGCSITASEILAVTQMRAFTADGAYP